MSQSAFRTAPSPQGQKRKRSGSCSSDSWLNEWFENGPLNPANQDILKAFNEEKETKERRSFSYQPRPSMACSSNSTDNFSDTSSTSSSRSRRSSRKPQNSLVCKKKRYPYSRKWRRKSPDPDKPGFVCLYNEAVYTNTIPQFIKKVPEGTNILAVQGMLNRPEAFLNPVLGHEHARRLKCFAECVEEMLGGLSIPEATDHTSKWFEADKTRNCHTRSLRSYAVVRSYGFANPPEFTTWLEFIYIAFTRGFTNAVGRKALEHVFFCCREILGMRVNKGTHNVGGNSKFPGNSFTIKIHQDLKSLTGDVLKNRVEEEFKNHDGTEYEWVSDCVMFNGRPGKFEEFYFFGECKTGKDGSIVTSMKNNIWHQSLRGLLELDCVTGCGICTKYVTLMKVKATHCKVITDTCDIELRSGDASQNFCFGTENFIRFIKLMVRIIQDNNKDYT